MNASHGELEVMTSWSCDQIFQTKFVSNLQQASMPIAGGKGKKPAVKRPPWQNDFSPAPLEDHSNNFQPGQIGVLTLDATDKTDTDACPAEIRLLPGTIKVGRDHKKCSEVFGSNAVSGTHCEIIVKSPSMITIADTKSTNGTYVNDTKIKSSVTAPQLSSGCLSVPM